MQYHCDRCSKSLDAQFATALTFRCPCGGALVPTRAAAPDGRLAGIDATRLPYPVALTLARLRQALASDANPLAALFAAKDCFEAGVKFLGSVLVAEYLGSPARTPDRDAVLLEKMVKPSLGHWVERIARPTSAWLAGGPVAGLFLTPGRGAPTETPLYAGCKAFVDYRNDALGHGGARSDARYREDLRAECLPVLADLLAGLVTLADRPLLRVTAEDRAQVWTGPEPSSSTVPGAFRREDIGRFVLGPRAGGSGTLSLFPFLSYLPGVTGTQNRLHYYDSLHRYTATRKEATVLEYDSGERHPRPEPLVGFEDAFTAELLAQAFRGERGRMAVIEGRVANFGELIEAHAGIVGRKFAVEGVHRFLRDNDRGLLVIEAEPGKGKTALMAHLIEEVFGGGAPRPVHFFYRRTAGITDPDVCVKSLYHALLESHGITEAAESQARQSPEEVSTKLTSLLTNEIAPRLSPGRPQLIFIDALDEANSDAFRRIPEGLPKGVYVIATTRPVAQRLALARREHLHWFGLDAPDLLAENLSDGREYVRRELLGAETPPETEDAVARVGAGNFLVLKLLCRHVRARLAPGDVPAFLHRLATGGGANQLGFIYGEFWERIKERCPPEFVQALCDVAGVLVLARAPLTREVITAVLGLNTSAWDFALSHLSEYLTAIREEETGTEETFYRVYHESFADFLRAQFVEGDRARLLGRLSDYCAAWGERPEGYCRMYAIRFGVTHALGVARTDRAVELLTDWRFLEARAEAGQLYELIDDLGQVSVRASANDHRGQWLGLILEAVRRDSYFLARHPECLFQSLWNSCWWYDCPELAAHRPQEREPWKDTGPKLSSFLERWRSEKCASSTFSWLRSLCPPALQLGGPKFINLKPHDDARCVTFSEDGTLVATCGQDGYIRVSEVLTGKLLHEWVARGHNVETVRFLHGSERIVSASHFVVSGRKIHHESHLTIWDVLHGSPLNRVTVEGRVRCMDLTHRSNRVIAGMSDGAVHLWERDQDKLYRLSRLETVPTALVHGVTGVRFTHDGCHCVAVTEDGTVSVWDSDTQQLVNSRRISEARHGCSAVAFSHQGDLLAVALWAGWQGSRSILILDSDTLDEAGAVEHSDENWPNSVAFFRSGRMLASGTNDGKLRLWSLPDLTLIREIELHEKYVLDIAIRNDDQTVALAGADGQARIVPLADLGCVRTHKSDRGDIYHVEPSPDQRHLASGGEGALLCVWEWHTGRLLYSRETLHFVSDIIFSPDGRHVVTRGNEDGNMQLWRVADGVQLWCRRGKPYGSRESPAGTGQTHEPVQSAAFLPACGGVITVEGAYSGPKRTRLRALLTGELIPNIPKVLDRASVISTQPSESLVGQLPRSWP